MPSSAALTGIAGRATLSMPSTSGCPYLSCTTGRVISASGCRPRSRIVLRRPGWRRWPPPQIADKAAAARRLGRRPGPVGPLRRGPCALVAGPGRVVRAAAAVGQRRGQAWPPEPPGQVIAYLPVPRAHGGPHRTDPADPRVSRALSAALSRCGVVPGQGVGGPQARVALLAVRAHQAANGIMPPPGGQRAGPDVGLAGRCRVVMPRDAGRHLTPGDRPPEPVTENSPLGDGNRASERVSGPWPLRQP
jgi:hypothetical protein